MTDSEPTPAQPIAPNLGEIVRYVLPAGNRAGETRPAIVVRVNSPLMVNLQVLLDGSNDLGVAAPLDDNSARILPGIAMWVGSAVLDAGGKPGTWSR